jgi:hypothetical protein
MMPPSDDMRFAERMLAADGDDEQAGSASGADDPDLLQGADADDVKDPGAGANNAPDTGGSSSHSDAGSGETEGPPEGGDEQSATAVDEDESTAGGDDSSGEAVGGDDEGEVTGPVQAQAYSQRSTNVGAKLSRMDKEQVKASYDSGDLRITLNSIFPRGGPVTGHTKVTVRAEGLEDLVEIFPDPKCKFGGSDRIVEANYIKCTKRPLTFYEGEKSATKSYTCVQCEDSPPYPQPEIISLAVSLTGKFDDVYSSRPYRYYEPARVDAIYPRYGPRDGDTVVRVWGANFLDLGDDFRCNFGTASTKARFVSDSFIWCRAARSSVVGKEMPFSVSLNRQQNTP